MSAVPRFKRPPRARRLRMHRMRAASEYASRQGGFLEPLSPGSVRFTYFGPSPAADCPPLIFRIRLADPPSVVPASHWTFAQCPSWTWLNGLPYGRGLIPLLSDLIRGLKERGVSPC